MSKFSDFYASALREETARKKLEEIIGTQPLEKLDDESLLRIGKLAEKLGYEIELEEAREYLRTGETELDEDDLEMVAGGKSTTHVTTYVCKVGGQAGFDEGNYGEGSKEISRSYKS